jgi:hypothetical protein
VALECDLLKRLTFFPVLLVFPILGLHPVLAQADDCDFYRKFLPGIYEINCTGGHKVHAASGSGSASVADSFNINPGALPTEPSPYGVEVIANRGRSDAAPLGFYFSIIKGFHKIGAGVSTASNNTFYGNDIVQRQYGTSEYANFDPPETPKSKLPNLNVGTSFAIIPARGELKTSLSLGLSGRYNHVTSTFGGGAGLLINSSYFTIGGGVVTERPVSFLGQINYYSATFGVKLFVVELESSWLWNSGAITLDPVQIGTLTVNLGHLILTAAERSLYFQREGNVFQTHYAVQVQVSKNLTLGYLYNYIAGANSMAVQIYL